MENKKKFDAPKNDPEFVKYWEKLLPKIVDRENFTEAFLAQLSVLCDLYVEYDKAMEFIKENGYGYMTGGRYGESQRPYIETTIRDKALSEIRAFSKLLGLTLAKDTLVNESPEAKDEW